MKKIRISPQNQIPEEPVFWLVEWGTDLVRLDVFEQGASEGAGLAIRRSLLPLFISAFQEMMGEKPQPKSSKRGCRRGKKS